MTRMTKRLILAATIAALVGTTLVGCGGKRTLEMPQPQDPAPTARRLTVEEYPIVEDSVDKPTHFEFMDRVDPQIREKRQAFREARPDIATMNQTLERWGYTLRIQDQPGEPAAENAKYSLYRGEELVLSDIWSWSLRGVHVNASETDWFFGAYSERTGGVLIRSGEILAWDEQEHLWTSPVYLGDDLAWVEVAENWKGYRLEREGETFYEGTMPEPMVDTSFKNFIAWDGHWAVEVDRDVIIDGESVGKTNGYGKVFTLRLIKGKPFYLFEKDGKIRLWYDGEVAEQTYDEVIHYMCCEPAAFNPGASESMVWFWARRGEMWHYVEAGVYE